MSHISVIWKDKIRIDKNSQLCCGCESCALICRQNAISMKYDEEGFVYPLVDNSKCVGCGLCTRVCPMLNYCTDNSRDYLRTLAGFSKKEEIISACASGGVCTALAYYVVSHGGIVFGVRYSESFVKTEYSEAETIELVRAFMTSKYVQSRKNNTFARVCNELRNNRLVLFIGTPCDIYALKLFLGKENDYHNLITVELVCMGVTSYKVAESYFESKKKYGKLISLNAKGKRYGWFVPCLEEVYEKRSFNKPFFGTYYGFGFTRFQRPSCSACPFRGRLGLGDIRVGDFWGIKKSDQFWNPQGVSSIFVRSEKGYNFLMEITKDDSFELFETPYEYAANNNNMDLSKNYTLKQLTRREEFANIFIDKGLIPACKHTASLEFWIKHYVPPTIAEQLKHFKHIIYDKKI